MPARVERLERWKLRISRPSFKLCTVWLTDFQRFSTLHHFCTTYRSADHLQRHSNPTGAHEVGQRAYRPMPFSRSPASGGVQALQIPLHHGNAVPSLGARLREVLQVRRHSPRGTMQTALHGQVVRLRGWCIEIKLRWVRPFNRCCRRGFGNW